MRQLQRIKIAFRADASLEIGIGHVMRCLTLADALSARGAECVFLCRRHPGHLTDLISRRGHLVYTLDDQGPCLSPRPSHFEHLPSHAAWLGCPWELDATQSIAVLDTWKPDWLVVDHYALDHRWEQTLRPYCRKLMVIDDLADRVHDCDLLLDSTPDRQSQTYTTLAPRECRLLLGSGYALLRPQFSALRTYSIERRKTLSFSRLLITLGGIDQNDVTSQLLDAIKDCSLPYDCEIDVVMGSHAPKLDNVRQKSADLPWKTNVRVDTDNMAELMAEADLAIGAAGSTSWERCCLGVPSLIVVLARNQKAAAEYLGCIGAAKILELGENFRNQTISAISSLITHPEDLCALSERAALLVDGWGADRTARELDS